MQDPTAPRIRPAHAADTGALVALWRRSVAATHDFLAPGDIDALAPVVREQVLGRLEVWVLEQRGQRLGFMALDGSMVEALFLDPAHARRGGGRQLLAHARELKGPLHVDVNEQNSAAVRFYRALGFEVAGRSAVDGAGRHYPLLHLRERGAAALGEGAPGKDPAREN